MVAQSNHIPNKYGMKDILIVDDYSSNAELLEAFLEPLGANIRMAVDGVDCLEKVREKIPDIILLDIMMPRMSGYEVCQKLKEDPKTRNIPVVIVTALKEEVDIERGMRCGAEDFLSQPIDKEALLKRVDYLLSCHKEKSELDRTIDYIAKIDGDQPDN